MKNLSQPWAPTDVPNNFTISEYELGGRDPRCPVCNKNIRIKKERNSVVAGSKCKCGVVVTVFYE